MGVDKNGTLSRRKIKKVERKSELDAGGTCKTIEQVGFYSYHQMKQMDFSDVVDSIKTI